MAKNTIVNIVNIDTPEFVSWFEATVKLTTDDHKARYTHKPSTFEFSQGSRYIKIIRVDCQRSVHAFIDRTNGDVLKPAGWKAPAKHARGNIFNSDNGMGCMTPYGPNYLR